MLSFRLVRNLSENKERSPTSEDDRLGYSVAALVIDKRRTYEISGWKDGKGCYCEV